MTRKLADLNRPTCRKPEERGKFEASTPRLLLASSFQAIRLVECSKF